MTPIVTMHRYTSTPVTVESASEGRNTTIAILATWNAMKEALPNSRIGRPNRRSRYS